MYLAHVIFTSNIKLSLNLKNGLLTLKKKKTIDLDLRRSFFKFVKNISCKEILVTPQI